MASIPDSFIDDLLLRVDLRDLLGRYITLKKAGSRWMGVCPFHGDTDPSLSVTPDKGFWYCFGCQAGGDAITFIRKQENLDFVEAVKFIAGLYGIPVPESASDPQASRRKILLDINNKALDFFVKVFKSKYGKPFVKYLMERGFDKDTVVTYRVGASLPGWDHLLKYLIKEGYSENDLADAGVAIARDTGGIYDRFRGRLMIPIIDTLDRTLGFGARAMGDDHPKYINSPESPIFLKSRILFGMNIAKKACRESGQLILMEGYTDVMQAHQAGVRNCCAVMGTALTAEHLPLLARFAGEIVLALDGDEAGKRATTRSLIIMAGSDFTVKVMPLPPGSDPADIIRSRGIDHFRKRVDASVDAADWLFRIYGEPVRDKSLPVRLKAFEEVASYIQAFSSHPTYDELQERAAIAFNMNLSALRSVLRQVREGGRRSSAGEPGLTVSNLDAVVKGGEEVERVLFLSLMACPKFLPEVKDLLAPEDFDHPLHRRLARVFFQPGFALGTVDGIKRLRDITEDEDLYSYVVRLTIEHEEDQEREEGMMYGEPELKSSLLYMIKRQYESEKTRLQSSMTEVQTNKNDGWQKNLIELQRELQKLEDNFQEMSYQLGGERASRKKLSWEKESDI